MKHNLKHIRHRNSITAELKQELFGELTIWDAGTIVLYTAFASILASLGIYAFAVYCI